MSRKFTVRYDHKENKGHFEITCPAPTPEDARTFTASIISKIDPDGKLELKWIKEVFE